MNSWNIWEDFGFADNPYDHLNLRADEVGAALLVGRDREVGTIQTAIASTTTHLSVEGPIGVGKTSLLSVAGFRMTTDCLAERRRALYLSASQFFQMQESLSAFELEVWTSVAQTLIANRWMFVEVGLPEPNVAGLERWLNSPEYKTWSASAALWGHGGGFGKGSQANDGGGFERAGMTKLVRDELTRCVPEGGGGIICVLDNLELLQSAGRARQTLEELRDRLFNIPQLRWVLCGAKGIVSRARSDRLSSIFQAPYLLGPLDPPAALEAVQARIAYYGGDSGTPPVTQHGFEQLYGAFHNNLRQALSTAQEFSTFLHQDYINQGRSLPSDAERDALLDGWLRSRAADLVSAAQTVQPRHWRFLVDLADRGGRAPSADFKGLGFRKQPQLTSAVSSLQEANLVIRETDPDDAKRSINTITPEGWLVHSFRADLGIIPTGLPEEPE